MLAPMILEERRRARVRLDCDVKQTLYDKRVDGMSSSEDASTSAGLSCCAPVALALSPWIFRDTGHALLARVLAVSVLARVQNSLENWLDWN